MRLSLQFYINTLVTCWVESYTHRALLSAVFFLLDPTGLDGLLQKYGECLLRARHDAGGYETQRPRVAVKV